MKILSISARNFLSLGDVFLDFDAYDGTPVVFTGGNGYGKSSIFEATVFALTGKTHRGLRGDSVVKRGSTGGTCVEADFQIEAGHLHVCRYRRDRRYKNSLRIYLDGEDLTKGTSELTQKTLYSLIGFTESSLLASILFGQNASGVSSFSDANLKVLVEAILGILDYQKAQAEAKEESSFIRGEIRGFQHKVEFLESTIEDSTLKLEEQKTKKEEELKENEEKIEYLKLHGKLFTIYKAIYSTSILLNNKKINELSSSLQDLKLKKQKIISSITRTKTNISHCDKEILKAKKLLSLGDCPTCLQPIEEGESCLNNKLLEDEERKRGLLEGLALEEEKAKEFRKVEVDFDEKLNTLRKEELLLIDKRFEFQDKIKEIKWNIKSLNKEMSLSFPNLKELTNQITELKLNLFGLRKKIKKKEQKLEEASFWVEGFGPSGLRNHLVHSVLPALNVKVQDYLEELSGGAITAEIDSQITKKGVVKFDKLRTRIWINNKEVELNSCSGGERRKVDIALGLALGDISGIGTLLFDEWFTDLDSDAMDSAFKILDRLCQTRRVIIATHHERFTETHIVNKIDNTTFIKEI